MMHCMKDLQCNLMSIQGLTGSLWSCCAFSLISLGLEIREVGFKTHVMFVNTFLLVN